MIIVIQNGTREINFDKVEIIGINIENSKQIACSFNNGKTLLGEYSTEERAKEVWIEIIQSYINSENYKYVNQLIMNVSAEILNRLQKGLVYEMPKE